MDDRLKRQIKGFGEAINGALSDSQQIARAVDRINEAGYKISVKLEANLGVRKRSEGASGTLASELGRD
jgi:hypothetical protein